MSCERQRSATTRCLSLGNLVRPDLHKQARHRFTEGGKVIRAQEGKLPICPASGPRCVVRPLFKTHGLPIISFSGDDVRAEEVSGCDRSSATLRSLRDIGKQQIRPAGCASTSPRVSECPGSQAIDSNHRTVQIVRQVFTESPEVSRQLASLVLLVISEDSNRAERSHTGGIRETSSLAVISCVVE